MHADNKRIVGWQQVRDRLIGYDNKPLMYVVGVACPDLVRTLPALQHDTVNAEDIDTEGDDHSADACFIGETQISTSTGQKSISELMVDELVFTRED